MPYKNYNLSSEEFKEIDSYCLSDQLLNFIEKLIAEKRYNTIGLAINYYLQQHPKPLKTETQLVRIFMLRRVPGLILSHIHSEIDVDSLAENLDDFTNRVVVTLECQGDLEDVVEEVVSTYSKTKVHISGLLFGEEVRMECNSLKHFGRSYKVIKDYFTGDEETQNLIWDLYKNEKRDRTVRQTERIRNYAQ